MSAGTRGQASVEWIGVVALALVLTSMLVLIAGPPLARAIEAALASALRGGAGVRVTPSIPTAADIADVQSALTGPDALTPDAALTALAVRHPGAEALAIADGILLQSARERSPGIGVAQMYRAWVDTSEGPFDAVPAGAGDHDAETPTGPPVITWVTVAAQRSALVHALSHHTRKLDVAIASASVVSFAGSRLGVAETETGEIAGKLAKRVSHDAGRLADTTDALSFTFAGDGGIPGGMLAGDLEIAWPVHRTAWRDGREDPDPPTDFGVRFSRRAFPAAYDHIVFLRPIAGGLSVVGQLLAETAG